LVARELKESVHVISGTSNSDGRTLDSAKNAPEIGVSGLEQVAFAEKRAAVFGRENEMYQQTGKGLRAYSTTYILYVIYGKRFSFALSALGRGGGNPS
jgi:hypothetical protein